MSLESAVIPKLNTALIEPLYLLERHLLSNRKRLEQWFADAGQQVGLNHDP